MSQAARAGGPPVDRSSSGRAHRPPLSLVRVRRQQLADEVLRLDRHRAPNVTAGAGERPRARRKAGRLGALCIGNTHPPRRIRSARAPACAWASRPIPLAHGLRDPSSPVELHLALQHGREDAVNGGSVKGKLPREQDEQNDPDGPKSAGRRDIVSGTVPNPLGAHLSRATCPPPPSSPLPFPPRSHQRSASGP